MKDLIEAMTILLKYANNDRCPTACSHDLLYIGCGIDDSSLISREDMKALGELGFFWDEDSNGFISFRFGSC